MRRSLKLVLPILLLTLSLGAVLAGENATHQIFVTIPEIIQLELSATSVDLGSFLVNGELLDTIAAENALTVNYRCNTPEWELSVKATKFENEKDSSATIPVSQLKWRKASEATGRQMGEFPSTVVQGNGPVAASTDIYYEMDRYDSAMSGRYSSTVTYTLVALP